MEFQEKRQHIRVPLSLPIDGKSVETLFNSHSFQGEIRDICYEGLGITIKSPNGFKVGQKVIFRTQLYPGDFKIKGEGVVCWVDKRNTAEQSANMGVKLSRIRHYGIWCEKIDESIPQTS